MYILNWYITKNYLVTFLMAIGVLTFGMAGAQLLKIFNFLAQGVPASSAFSVLLYFIPHALCFTLPWASLVSIMLVFGRMSADNEITAMRACGVSILQIVAPLIVTTICFTAVCLQLQFETGPKAMKQMRNVIEEVGVNYPLALFTPGSSVSMDHLVRGGSIYFSSRDDENNIYNVQVYKISDRGVIEQDATAARGRIEVDALRKVLKVILFDAMVENRDGGKDAPPIQISMKKAEIEFNYGEKFNEGRLAMREKYLTLEELLARTVIEKREGRDTTSLEVELNQRVALALAPIAFLLLGLPLAIRTSRRETSVGLFLSVLLAGVYFAGMLLSDALRKEPKLYPQYIVWAVPMLYQVFGMYYIIRIARK